MDFDDDDDVFSAKAKPQESQYAFEEKTDTDVPETRKPNEPPAYLRDALNRYLRENPNAIQFADSSGYNRKIPSVIDVFKTFTDAAAHSTNKVEESSAMRAIFDVLDEMTEGSVTRRAEIYMLEQKLMHTFAIMKFANDMYARMSTFADADPTPKFLSFVAYLKTYIEILDFTVQDLSAEYSKMCEERQYAASESVLNCGRTEWGNIAACIWSTRIQSLTTYKHGTVHNLDDYMKMLSDFTYITLMKKLFEPEDNQPQQMAGVIYI